MDAPVDTQAAGSQIPSALRQRMLKRAATFAEGSQSPAPTLSRRRSSLLSNLSEAQHSFRSSTDSLPQTTSRNDTSRAMSPDEPTYWHSSPILFAIVPAVAALTHQNGGAFASDILLILLACWFMRLCVVTPWEWYHNAQQRQYVELDVSTYEDDTIAEEDDESVGSPERPDSAKSFHKDSKNESKPIPSSVTDMQENARKELRREELLAFVACFLGPLIAAYMLHAIRSQLTTTTRDGIISNLNLTIFVLAAEIRPISRLVRMKNERTLHLQRLVNVDPKARLRTANAQELSHRLAELESRIDDPMHGSSSDIMKANTDMRLNMQLQLDALNRAVRKYEKRHMAQSIQLEARFQELDLRLKDTLSLAAAAARTGQRPGIIAMTISWVASLVNYTLQLAWDIALYPWRTTASFIGIGKSLISNEKKSGRKNTRGPVNGHSSLSSSRMQKSIR